MVPSMTSTPVRGVPLVVPSASYPTIQSAIDSAFSGDSIMLAAGNYSEDIMLYNKTGISFVGAGASAVVISSAQITSCNDLHFEGLGFAGIVDCYDCANLTFANVSINSTTDCLDLNGCNGITIAHMSCNSGELCVWLNDTYDTIISNSTLSANTGCILARESGNITVCDCTLDGASSASNGASFYLCDDMTVERTTISNATGETLYLDYCDHATIANCTLSGNEASMYGLDCLDSNVVRVSDMTVRDIPVISVRFSYSTNLTIERITVDKTFECNNSETEPLTIEWCSQATIRSLTFTSSVPGEVWQGGISLNGVTDSVVEYVNFLAPSFRSASVQNCENVTIRNVNASLVDYIGVLFDSCINCTLYDYEANITQSEIGTTIGLSLENSDYLRVSSISLSCTSPPTNASGSVGVQVRKAEWCALSDVNEFNLTTAMDLIEYQNSIVTNIETYDCWNGLTLMNSHDVCLANVTISNTTEDGLSLSGCERLNASSVHIENANHGLVAENLKWSAFEETSISDCEIGLSATVVYSTKFLNVSVSQCIDGLVMEMMLESTIEHAYAYNCPVSGVSITHSFFSTFSDISATLCERGISVMYSAENIFENISAQDAIDEPTTENVPFGMFFNDASRSHMSRIMCSNAPIMIRSTALSKFEEVNATLAVDADCITIMESRDCIISRATVTHSDADYSGVLIDQSTNITLIDTAIFDSYYGVHITNSRSCAVINTTSSNHIYGLEMYIVTDSIVTNSEFSYATGGYAFGIVLIYSDNNTVEKTSVCSATYGVSLDSSNNNKFINNTVTDCEITVDIVSCDGNKLYHNSFMNTSALPIKTSTSDSETCWNDSIKGNYWSDYNGTDTNGDLIGDTNLPHNEDFAPLVRHDVWPSCVLSTNPPQNGDFAMNENITFIFSEAINIAPIMASPESFMQLSGVQANITDLFYVNATPTALTLEPKIAAQLLGNYSTFVVILSSIADMSGNEMPQYSLYLHPKKGPCATGSALASPFFDPHTGRALAGSETTLQIFFDAKLDATQELAPLIMLVTEGEPQMSVSLCENSTAINVTMTGLPFGATHTIIVSQHLLGANGYQMGCNQQFNFSTIPTPIAMLDSPMLPANDVLPNATIMLKFTQPVDNYALYSHLSLRSPTGQSIFGSLNSDDNETCATFVPTLPLNYSTTYVLTLEGLVSKWNCMFAKSVWSFTTTALPTVDIVYPASVMGIMPDAEFMLAFSKPANKPSAESHITLSDASGVLLACTFTWDGAQILHIRPNFALDFSTNYTLALDGALDVQGIAFQSSTLPLTFTTYALGSAVLLSPSAGATKVSTKADLVLKFDRQVNVTSISSALSVSPIAEMQIKSVTGETLVIQFPRSLMHSREYTIKLEGAKDLEGYPLKENYTWVFTTEKEPAKVSEVPFILIVSFASLACVLGATSVYFWYNSKQRKSVYITESVFIMSPDGRLMGSKIKEGLGDVLDRDIFTSMFTAVQSFVADSFGGEELGAIKHGDKTITVVKGKHCQMMVTTYGEPDGRLQKKASAALSEFESRHAAELSNWSGIIDIFAHSMSLFDPLFALSSGITREKVDEFARKRPLSITCNVALRAPDRTRVNVELQNMQGEPFKNFELMCNLQMLALASGAGTFLSPYELLISELQRGVTTFEIDMFPLPGKRITFSARGKTKSGKEKSASVSTIL